MTMRRLFFWLPIGLIVLMVMSVLLVPSYQAQSRGNPERLRSFVEPSIGDAQLLNPILNADTASSRIVSLVFDGLLEYDADLRLVPALASSYAIREVLYINIATANSGVMQRLNEALEENNSLLNGAVVQSVQAVEPINDTWSVTIDEEAAKSVNVTVRYRERIKLSLSKVVPDAESTLTAWLGQSWHSTEPDIQRPSGTFTSEQTALIDAAIRERVMPVEHNPVIDFTLRDNARFHDGEPFTSDDVVFTYDSIMNAVNASPRTSSFDAIKSVTANGPYEVTVVYKQLFSPAVEAWTMPILPQHLLDQDQVEIEMDAQGITGEARLSFGMRQMPFNRRPIGTGAYRFSQWLSDDRIELTKNAEYWRDTPQFDRYTYRILPDPFSQELELKSGSVDILKPQPHQVKRFKDDSRFNSVTNTAFSYSYIGYNLRRKPFQDPRVRRALAMAINVDDMIEYVLHGEGERTSGPYPRTTPWSNPQVKPVPYDPQSAARLLTEAGYSRNADGWLEKDGVVLEFNLITNQGNAVRKAILAIAQDSWRRLGIRCNTQVFEWAVFLKDFVNVGAFDALVLGWSLSPDPDQYQLWHSTQTGPSQLNFTGYQSDEADQLIEAIRLEYDREKQQALTSRLHELIAQDQPYTFLFNLRDTRILNRTLARINRENTPEPVRSVNSGDVFQEFLFWGKREHSLTFQ